MIETNFESKDVQNVIPSPTKFTISNYTHEKEKCMVKQNQWT